MGQWRGYAAVLEGLLPAQFSIVRSRYRDMRCAPVRALGWVLVTVALLAALMFPGGASASGEFQSKYFNATQCVLLQEENLNGTRSVAIGNKCRAEIGILGCFRTVKPTAGYKRPGWYCTLKMGATAGGKWTISRLGFYHPHLKGAACSMNRHRCLQTLRTVFARVRTGYSDPEAYVRTILDKR